MDSRPTALVVGGSSGLGLELALRLAKYYGHKVHVTGRTNPKRDEVTFHYLELDAVNETGEADFERLLTEVPEVDLLIYAAGFFQSGYIAWLDYPQIIAMTNVGFLAPAMLISRILKKQVRLPGFIAITSTSQWTPREKEPIYTGVKAGLWMLANSLSEDPEVGKVLVAGPSGMRTRFWEKEDRPTEKYLDPVWVAQQVLKEYEEDFGFKMIRVLREPSRVEVVESR